MTLLEQRGKATGVGLGMFGGAVAMQNQVIDHQEYFYVDNYYLKLMIEMGYTGLSAFLITVLSFLANGCRALYRTAQQKKAGAVPSVSTVCGDFRWTVRRVGSLRI